MNNIICPVCKKELNKAVCRDSTHYVSMDTEINILTSIYFINTNNIDIEHCFIFCLNNSYKYFLLKNRTDLSFSNRIIFEFDLGSDLDLSDFEMLNKLALKINNNSIFI